MSEEMKQLLSEYAAANNAWREADGACSRARYAAEKARENLEGEVFRQLYSLPVDVVREAVRRIPGIAVCE